LAGVLAAGTGIAAAQTTNCTGTLAPGSYAAVNVPAGKTCRANAGAVTVAGNLTVGKGVSLFAGTNAEFTVNGSVLGVDACTIGIKALVGGATNILGNVSLTGTTCSVTIATSFIGGTVLITNSNAVGIGVEESNVAGSVILQNNKTGGFPDSDVIGGNVIGGSLACANNTPPPANLGSPNTVGGSKVAQCSGL
jgi:hypothetical protein